MHTGCCRASRWRSSWNVLWGTSTSRRSAGNWAIKPENFDATKKCNLPSNVIGCGVGICKVIDKFHISICGIYFIHSTLISLIFPFIADAAIKIKKKTNSVILLRCIGKSVPLYLEFWWGVLTQFNRQVSILNGSFCDIIAVWLLPISSWQTSH